MKNTSYGMRSPIVDSNGVCEVRLLRSFLGATYSHCVASLLAQSREAQSCQYESRQGSGNNRETGRSGGPCSTTKTRRENKTSKRVSTPPTYSARPNSSANDRTAFKRHRSKRRSSDVFQSSRRTRYGTPLHESEQARIIQARTAIDLATSRCGSPSNSNPNGWPIVLSRST